MTTLQAQKNQNNMSWGSAILVCNLKCDLLALNYVSTGLIYLNQTEYIDFQE